MPRQRRNSAESTRCLFARGSESKNKQSSPRHALWDLSGAGYGKSIWWWESNCGRCEWLKATALAHWFRSQCQVTLNRREIIIAQPLQKEQWEESISLWTYGFLFINSLCNAIKGHPTLLFNALSSLCSFIVTSLKWSQRTTWEQVLWVNRCPSTLSRVQYCPSASYLQPKANVQMFSIARRWRKKIKACLIKRYHKKENEQTWSRIAAGFATPQLAFISFPEWITFFVGFFLNRNFPGIPINKLN